MHFFCDTVTASLTITHLFVTISQTLGYSAGELQAVTWCWSLAEHELPIDDVFLAV